VRDLKSERPCQTERAHRNACAEYEPGVRTLVAGSEDYAAFNLGLQNIAIYLVTQVAMGAKEARTYRGSSGFHNFVLNTDFVRTFPRACEPAYTGT
jgi:hypothetical protein